MSSFAWMLVPLSLGAFCRGFFILLNQVENLFGPSKIKSGMDSRVARIVVRLAVYSEHPVSWTPIQIGDDYCKCCWKNDGKNPYGNNIPCFRINRIVVVTETDMTAATTISILVTRLIICPFVFAIQLTPHFSFSFQTPAFHFLIRDNDFLLAELDVEKILGYATYCDKCGKTL